VPARDEAVAAYRLQPNEPEAIRAVAQLFSRASQPESLKFWHELEARTPLTRTDLRDEANLALRARELDVASGAVEQLISARDGGPTASDWLIAAQLSLQQQNPDDALVHVRQVFASSTASRRDQLQATLTLDTILRSKESNDLSGTFKRLDELAHGSDDVSLDALVALAQRILNAPAQSHDKDAMSPKDIVAALENHPLAKPQHKLLTFDLKMHEQPEEKEQLLQAAVKQYKNGDSTELQAVAGWLNSHGEFQRELDAIPRQRAMQTRELFFQHVDAMGALGQWDEIRRLIESEQFPLDPVVEHMYLARCFTQQNQMQGAENNWGRALQAAAGDMNKLMLLGDYAEKNGALDIAGSAYDAAVNVVPKSRPVQQGRLRIAYAQRDTKKIHAILADLLKLWPTDTSVLNDEAYVRLLLLPANADPNELHSIEELAVQLVQREPSSLPHRSLLALARLKQNKATEAMTVYEGITAPRASLTTASIAIHAATLAANGKTEQARAESSQLPKDKMLPEERVLIPQ
jgi:tetratricopeptide (TPR) repeat protein